jgi:hypothetical protein
MTKLLLSIFVFVWSVCLRADEVSVVSEVRAADDSRIAAMISADGNELDAILSDELHYAHSAEGFVQDKNQHIASLVDRRLIYQRFDFKTRDFSIVAPGVVLSRGRVLVDVGSDRMTFLVDINFLAVWRKENHRWKLLAWQSSRNAEIVPLAPASERRPNKPVQHNAGGRPSSDDSPASATPSEPAPRG